MGKAANNERIKLRAAFYNNLATGFVITGYAVPYFTFMREWWNRPQPESFSGFLRMVFIDSEVWLLSALGLWVILIAWFLRRMTNQILDQIEDQLV
jgi:hypothetical protein